MGFAHAFGITDHGQIYIHDLGAQAIYTRKQDKSRESVDHRARDMMGDSLVAYRMLIGDTSQEHLMNKMGHVVPVECLDRFRDPDYYTSMGKIPEDSILEASDHLRNLQLDEKPVTEIDIRNGVVYIRDLGVTTRSLPCMDSMGADDSRLAPPGEFTRGYFVIGDVAEWKDTVGAYLRSRAFSQLGDEHSITAGNSGDIAELKARLEAMIQHQEWAAGIRQTLQ